MRLVSPVLLGAACCATVVSTALAQNAAAAKPIPPAAQQIAAAITALPEDLRPGAAVLGYTALWRPIVLLLPVVWAALALTSKSALRRRALALALFVAFGLVVGPWVLRSSLLAGD